MSMFPHPKLNRSPYPVGMSILAYAADQVVHRWETKMKGEHDITRAAYRNVFCHPEPMPEGRQDMWWAYIDMSVMLCAPRARNMREYALDVRRAK